MAEGPDYQPRAVFEPLHERNQRWACVVAHRRCGKTVATVFDLLTHALAFKGQSGRFAYIAPFREQAKTIAWDYLKRYAAPLKPKVSESDLHIELQSNGARVRLFGADNYDALRGMYLDGVILDEYGDMRPQVWGEVVRPLLSDRLGWATFIGTPKGKNHFWEIYRQASTDPDWLCLTIKASESGLVAAPELADARRTMTPEQYAQEYECAFDVPALGAIYREEMSAAQASGRITQVPHDPALPVHTAWDLGVGDATSIWFVQLVGAQVRVIDYYEATGQGIPHYVQALKAKPYTYGSHLAPHDIGVREFGSGRTRLETAQSLGITFRVLPRMTLEDGINATRVTFGRLWFDERACQQGLECLRNYRREMNQRLGELKPEPVHDWASHGADAMRYLCMGLDQLSNDSWGGELKYPKINNA